MIAAPPAMATLSLPPNCIATLFATRRLRIGQTIGSSQLRVPDSTGKRLAFAKPSPADVNAGVKERAGNGRLFPQSIQNACVNALVDAGYGNENVRVYRAEVFAQKHDRAVEHDGASHAKSQVVACCAFKCVRERQEG